jgi:uncharacterized membrane protein
MAPLAIAVPLAFLAWPGALSARLLWAMRGACALRPDHSYFVGGVQLPLEARTTGIYGGLLVALLTLLILRRGGKRRLGSSATNRLLLLFVAIMASDGINSTLADLGWPHLYAPTNALRLSTGLLAGVAIAPLLLWLLGHAATPRDRLRDESLLRSPRDLVVPLAAAALYGALIVTGAAWLYLPLALIAVAGVVALISGVVLLLALRLTGREGRVTHRRDLVGPAAASLLVAYVILAALSLAHGV